MIRFSLTALLVAVSLSPGQAQTCGVGTIFVGNQCVCTNTTVPDDPNTILLGGLLDLEAFPWSEDVFNVTVSLINQGFWEFARFPPPQRLVYDLRDSSCGESEAVRAYWDIRQSNGNRPPHGIVGARCSGASTQVARISGLEGVPQISPASDTAVLSNTDEFPYFARTVAPSNEQGEAGAMVALLREFGWDRVMAVTSDTPFAKDFLTSFRKLWLGPHSDASGSWTGSIPFTEQVRLDPQTDLVDEESLNQVLSSIPNNDPDSGSRIILLFAHNRHAFPILEAATRQGFQQDTIWVGPSSWVGRTWTTDFSWLPPTPGYIGTSLFRNRDDTYIRFLGELQSYQARSGKPVLEELPPFAAETVDSIVALAAALADTSDRRDGLSVVQNLKQINFDGVSGPVAFSAEGDRRDPQYSVYNAQSAAIEGDIPWNAVGYSGTTVGSAVVDVMDTCFRGFACSVIPDDSYPATEDATKIPLWVIILVVTLAALFIAIAFKYWRSRRSKNSIKAELEVFQNSVVGMRAALCDYVPKVALPSRGDGDVEEALAPTETTVSIVPKKNVIWCWKETEYCMNQHDPANVHGDPSQRWIKYDDESNKKLEAAYQNGQDTVNLQSGTYQVSISKLLQTKLQTNFERDVLRVEEEDDVSIQATSIDTKDLTFGDTLPSDLIGEPQMVLVSGDILQISTQRDDGWAFGTKLHHADEKLARGLLTIATSANDNTSVDDANVFTDTGWFQLSSTRMPTSEDLTALQSSVGKVDPSSLDPPPFWDPVQDATVAQSHELKEGHPERDAVVNSFMSTLGGRNIKVVKVERIQNLAMYQSYVVKRSTICYRELGHDGAGNDEIAQQKAIDRFERSWLWHGSNVEVVGKIMNQGFNRSFCGKNATVYGKGVYFARDSSYSASTTYSVPDFKGNQYMLACRVCVGEYCPGTTDALTPDVRDAKNQSLYDSTVGLLSGDTMINPSIYVTYHDAQAYPEYLVTFRQ